MRCSNINSSIFVRIVSTNQFAAENKALTFQFFLDTIPLFSSSSAFPGFSHLLDQALAIHVDTAVPTQQSLEEFSCP